jgi:general secretion pathway protein J
MRPLTARPPRGFTLVEVMVALLIMGVIAAMAWQGVDGMVRSRDISAARLEQQLRLQSVIAQWEADLDQVQDSGIVPALQFDGANLRMTRRNAGGLQLVVWSLRGESWTRWTAPPATRVLALQEQWMRSQQLLGNEPEQLKVMTGVTGWQLYFWRGNGWSNAQSTGDVAPPGTDASGNAVLRQLLPEGVRLVLTFGEGAPVVGTLTRDLRLAPQSVAP